MGRGFVDEVRALARRGPREGRTANRALGYRRCWPTSTASSPSRRRKEQTVTGTRRFARRQDSWFRKDPRITWVGHDDPDRVERALALVAVGEPDHGRTAVAGWSPWSPSTTRPPASTASSPIRRARSTGCSSRDIDPDGPMHYDQLLLDVGDVHGCQHLPVDPRQRRGRGGPTRDRAGRSRTGRSRSRTATSGSRTHRSERCTRRCTRAAGEQNLWLVGGGELVGQFHDAGLLDEVWVQYAPVTLGGRSAAAATAGRARAGRGRAQPRVCVRAPRRSCADGQGSGSGRAAGQAAGQAARQGTVTAPSQAVQTQSSPPSGRKIVTAPQSAHVRSSPRSISSSSMP